MLNTYIFKTNGGIMNYFLTKTDEEMAEILFSRSGIAGLRSLIGINILFNLNKIPALDRIYSKKYSVSYGINGDQLQEFIESTLKRKAWNTRLTSEMTEYILEFVVPGIKKYRTERMIASFMKNVFKYGTVTNEMYLKYASVIAPYADIVFQNNPSLKNSGNELVNAMNDSDEKILWRELEMKRSRSIPDPEKYPLDMIFNSKVINKWNWNSFFGKYLPSQHKIPVEKVFENHMDSKVFGSKLVFNKKQEAINYLEEIIKIRQPIYRIKDTSEISEENYRYDVSFGKIVFLYYLYLKNKKLDTKKEYASIFKTAENFLYTFFPYLLILKEKQRIDTSFYYLITELIYLYHLIIEGQKTYHYEFIFEEYEICTNQGYIAYNDLSRFLRMNEEEWFKLLKRHYSAKSIESIRDEFGIKEEEIKK